MYSTTTVNGSGCTNLHTLKHVFWYFLCFECSGVGRWLTLLIVLPHHFPQSSGQLRSDGLGSRPRGLFHHSTQPVVGGVKDLAVEGTSLELLPVWIHTYKHLCMNVYTVYTYVQSNLLSKYLKGPMRIK